MRATVLSVLLAACTSFFLLVARQGNGQALTLVNTFHTGNALETVVEGPLAYVANDTNFKIIDISDPASPQEIGSVDLPGTAFGVVLSGSNAYVADGYAGLKIIDVSNPSLPQVVGSYDTPGFSIHLALAGQYAYVADSEAGLRIINVSNPAAPTLAGSLATTSFTRGVAVVGNLAYLVNYFGSFTIADVSNVHAPREIGRFDDGGAFNAIAITDMVAVITRIPQGCQTFDISDPMNPIPIGVDPTGASTIGGGVTIRESLAYVTESSQFKILDISDPYNPFPIVTYPAGASNIALQNDLIYLSAGPLIILRYNPNGVNPANGARLVANSIPAQIAAGNAVPLEITFENDGASLWRASSGYALNVAQDSCALVTPGLLSLDSNVTVRPGESYTFRAVLRAPSATDTNCALALRMIQSGVGFGDSFLANIATITPINDAIYLSDTVPPTLRLEAAISVGFTLRNEGNTVWSAEDNFALAVVQDSCGLFNGVDRILLNEDQFVKPNEKVQFVGYLVAPPSRRMCHARLRMVKDENDLFGAPFEFSVQVEPPANASDDWKLYE